MTVIVNLEKGSVDKAKEIILGFKNQSFIFLTKDEETHGQLGQVLKSFDEHLYMVPNKYFSRLQDS